MHFAYVLIYLSLKSNLAATESKPTNVVATYLIGDGAFQKILNKSAMIDILGVKHFALNNTKEVKILAESIIIDLLRRDKLEPVSAPIPYVNESGRLLGPTRRRSNDLDQFHPSFDRYLSLEELMDYVNELPALSTQTKKIEVETIGKSYEGREIKLVKILNGQSNNDIMFFDCGIHGREWISVMMGAYLLQELTDSGKHSNLNSMDWYIIPTINPDSYVESQRINRMQRKNKNFSKCPSRCHPPLQCGVDLNRNFPYHYGESGVSSDPCSTEYFGTGPLSEPESQALASTLQKYAKKIKLYVTLHSYGKSFLYPWGYEPKKCDNWKDLEAAAETAIVAMKRYSNGLYEVKNSALLYPAAGGSDDYARSLNIPFSYTMELQGDDVEGFGVKEYNIKKYLEENFAGLSALTQFVQNFKKH